MNDTTARTTKDLVRLKRHIAFLADNKKLCCCKASISGPMMVPVVKPGDIFRFHNSERTG